MNKTAYKFLICVAGVVYATLSATTVTWSGGTNTNWNNSSNWNSTFPNSSTVTALFPNGSNSTCLVNGVFSVATLDFNDLTISLNSGGGDSLDLYTSIVSASGAAPSINCPLFLENSINITLDMTSSVQFLSTLTGNSGAGVTITGVSGGGVCGFSGATSYNGTTTIAGGTLEANSSNCLSSSSAFVLDNTAGVSLVLAGNNNEIGSLAGGGTTGGSVSLQGATLTIGNDGTPTSFAGGIINGGTGGGGITKIGGGTLTLSGTNTYTGLATVSGGALSVNSSGALGGSVALTGGTLLAFGSFSTSNTVSITGTSGIISVNDGETLTLNGAISDGGSSGELIMTSNGAGILVLGTSNSYSGGTTIDSGTLSIGADSALGNTTSGFLALNGGALAVTGSFTLASGRTVTTSSSSSPINVSSGKTFIIGQAIANGSSSGGLNLNGAGTLELEASCSYSQPTVINSGTLALIGTGSISDSNQVGVYGTLDVTQITGGSISLNTLYGSGSLVTSSMTTDQLKIFQNSDETFSGVISGDAQLVFGGNDRLYLTNTNTYTGGTELTNGTLLISSDGGLGPSTTAVLFSGGSLGATSSFTLSSSRALTVTNSDGGIAVANGVTFIIGQAIADASMDSGAMYIFSNNDSDGDGVVVFSGTNTYSGGTYLDSAVLSVAADSALGATSGLLYLDGGTLEVTSSFTLNSSRSVYIGDEDSGISVANGQTLTINQAIVEDGDGGLNVSSSGNGILQLGGVCTYYGHTDVNSGTLELLSGASIADAQQTSISSGATLDASAAGAGTVTLQTLLGSGSLIGNTSQTLAITQNSDQTFSGGISGFTVGLVKNGGSQLELSGTNSYTGGTLINDGTLAVTADSGLGATSGQVTIAGGTLSSLGTFVLEGTRGAVLTTSLSSGIYVQDGDTFTIDQAINNGGSTGGIILTSNSQGILVLGGTNGYSGGTSIDSGVLSIAADAALGNTSGFLKINGGTLQATSTFSLTDTRAVSTSSDSSTINVATSQTLTVPQAIADGASSGGITLTSGGTGILEITAACTYTGPTTIDSGTLVLSGSGAIATATSTTVASGGTLDVTAAASPVSIQTLSGAGDIVGDTQLLQVIQGSDQTFSGQITGVSALAKQGTGVLTLTGNNGYAVNTAIQNGTLSIGSDSSLGNTSGSLLFEGGTLSVTATFELASTRTTTTATSTSGISVTDGNTFTISQNIGDGSSSGAFTVSSNGAGVLVLSGMNSFTGGMTIDSGALSISADAALGASSGSLNLAGGTLHVTSGFTISGTRAVTTSNSSSGIEIDGGDTLVIPQVIANGGSSGGITLTSGGAGILEIQSSCTYTGPTVINSGKLTLTHSGSLPDTSATTIDTGSSIDASGITGSSFSLNNLSGGGNLIITGKTFLLNQSSGESFGGIISGASGNVTMSGSGSLTLTAASTYSGATAINAGTILLSGNGTIADSTSLAIASGATLDLRGTGLSSLSFQNLSGAGTIQTTSTTITIDQTQSGTFSGAINESATLILTGGSTLALTGSSSYSGGTRVQAGVLSVSGDGALGSSSGFLSLEGGNLAVTSTFPLSGGRTFTTAGSSTTIEVSTGVTFTVNPVLADGGSSGNLTVTSGGSGIVLLNNACTYTGPTAVNSGTLALGSGGSIGDSSSTAIASGATLDLTAATSGITLKTLSGAGNITSTGQSVNVNQGSSQVFSGSMSGSLLLVKQGTGTLTLSNSNTLGSATVSDGILLLSGSGTIGVVPVSLAGGTTFDVTNVSASGTTIGTLSGSGTISSAGKTLAITQASNETFSGALNGDSSTSLTLNGTAALTLSGTANYSGATNINSGKLALSGTTSIAGSSATTLASGATLDVSGVTGGVTLPTLSGGGTLTGTGRDITIDQTATATFSGSISGNTLTKTGSSPFTFTGTATYAGNTSVEEGLFSLNTSIPGALSVASGATLKGTGTIGGDATISGTIQPGNSIGTMYVMGALVLDSGSTTSIEISPTQSSEIIVSGAASLDGTLSITADPGIYIGQVQYTILTAGGGVTPGFTSIIGGALGSELQVEYLSDSVILTYLTQLRDFNITGNAENLINYLNANSANPLITPIFTVLGVLAAGPLMEAAISITPARNATATFASQNTMFTFAKSVSSHMAGQRMLRSMFKKSTPSEEEGLLTYLDLAGRNQSSITPAGSVKKLAKEEDIYSIWIDGFAEASHQGAQDQIPSFDVFSGGFLVGFDAYLNNRGEVGCAAGYARDALHETGDVGSSLSNLCVATLYGTYYLGQTYIEAEVWGTYDRVETSRTVTYPGFYAKAKGAFNGIQLTPHLGLGYDFVFKHGVVEPFIKVDWVFNFEHGYTEHGASPLNMIIKGSASSMLRLETGLSCYQMWEKEVGILVLREAASYVYKHPYAIGKMTAAIVGLEGTFLNDSFTSIQDLFAPSFEIFYRHKQSGIFSSLQYEGEFGRGYRTNEVLMRLGKYF